jgi:hypothetical protein
LNLIGKCVIWNGKKMRCVDCPWTMSIQDTKFNPMFIDDIDPKAKLINLDEILGEEVEVSA